MPYKINEIPDIEELNQLFICDPDRGELVWRARDAEMFSEGHRNSAQKKADGWNTKNAGRPAGCYHQVHGYVRVGFGGKTYASHRIIWKMATGLEPDFIDHINGDRSDNRIENLRSVPHIANDQNRVINPRNKSGVTGVNWHERIGKWHAKIKANYVDYHLGYFDNLEEAAKARKNAEKLHGFHENHGRAA